MLFRSGLTRSDKNPHTATRRAKNKFMERIPNPCYRMKASNSRERGGGNVGEGLGHIRQVPSDYKNGDSSCNELGGRNEESMRFDGWSLLKSTEYPFLIIGADGDDLNPRVITPTMMEALRSFMPFKVSEYNFWLKFSLVRDGASLATLLGNIHASIYTVIAVETNHGEVFGSFTGAPWRVGGTWYGTSEAFLWRLKKGRYTSPKNSRIANIDREMEVYPYTGDDRLVQYCTSKTIAVGGGDWQHNLCPYNETEKGIGFMIDGDLAGGETNSCATFANPKLAKHATASSEFVISNLEVWTLTPCESKEDAINMELRGLLSAEEHGFI